MKIGDKIKEYRQQRGMTLEQLADKVGLTKSMLSKYENGRNQPPYDRVIDIAIALDVGVGELYGWAGTRGGVYDDVILEPDEEELLMLYSGLDDEQKKQVLDFIEFLGSK